MAVGDLVTLQADEHIRQSIVRGLRTRGVSVSTIADVGLEGASDKRLLEYCRARGWLLLTNDDDLLALCGAGSAPGIVFQTTQFVEPGTVVRSAVRLLDSAPVEELQGRVFFVP